MEINDNINDIIEYRYSNKVNKEQIHIGYGIDDDYARCTATSMISFFLNNEDKVFNFHVVTNNLSKENKEKFRCMADKYKFNIFIYEIKSEFFSSLPQKDYWSVAMYFRFILPILLEKIPKLFYVDADTLCLQRCNGLFDINLKNNVIGAVLDVKRVRKKREQALNLRKNSYFNSGVLVINIKEWNKLNLLEKTIEIISKEPKKFKYPDQDALNFLLNDKVQYINKIFNCIDINLIDEKSIAIMHFANHPKPWSEMWKINIIYNTFTKDLYTYYEEKTPWKGMPLEKLKNRQILIKSYIKYILSKMFKLI
ncbi:glycosyltransferase family 8 protein [Megamonas funiformis]|uniref:glycosyltransferase family 8 protein n=1 Tax=Megamonas funiformis TaxID=437897 RepID=UPI00265CA6C3|nr:glycosyltransferase family 8 protein [Megamonas funiformis]